MDVATEIAGFVLDCGKSVFYIAGIIAAVVAAASLYAMAAKFVGPPFIRWIENKASTTKEERRVEGRDSMIMAGILIVPTTILEFVLLAGNVRERQYVRVRTDYGTREQPRFSDRQECALFGARVLLEAFFMFLVLSAVGKIFGPKKLPIQETTPTEQSAKEDAKSK